MDQIIPSHDTDNARRLRAALGRYATGVTVVTAMGTKGPVGMTVNSFTSVSIDPPLVLWCPARASARFSALTGSAHHSIHVMGTAERDLCAHFARSGDDFENIAWTPTPEGVPTLPGHIARFDCETQAVHDGGDHAIVVARILRASLRDQEPLIFWNGRFGTFLDHHRA